MAGQIDSTSSTSVALSLSLQSRKHLPAIATAAPAGVAYFVAMIVALHVLRSDDPIRQPTSAYAVGQYGYLMTSAFLSVSLASLALVIGLTQAVAAPARSRIGLGLLTTWSVGVLVAMIFPIDVEGAPRTMAGTIHRVAGLLAFLSLTSGAALVSRDLKQDDDWRRIQRISVVLSAAMLALFIVTGVSIAADTGYVGLSQRMLLATFVTWFTVIATHLRVLTHRS